MRLASLGAATKFMGGHSDVLAGVVTSNGGTEAGLAMGIAIREYQGAAGGVCSPFDAWLVLRGLRSMDVRGDRAKRASLDEDSSDKSRDLATDGYIHY